MNLFTEVSGIQIVVVAKIKLPKHIQQSINHVTNIETPKIFLYPEIYSQHTVTFSYELLCNSQEVN